MNFNGMNVNYLGNQGFETGLLSFNAFSTFGNNYNNLNANGLNSFKTSNSNKNLNNTLYPLSPLSPNSSFDNSLNFSSILQSFGLKEQSKVLKNATNNNQNKTQNNNTNNNNNNTHSQNSNKLNINNTNNTNNTNNSINTLHAFNTLNTLNTNTNDNIFALPSLTNLNLDLSRSSSICSIGSTRSNSASNSVSNSVSNSTNGLNSSNTNNTNMARVHYLWQCNIWTQVDQDVTNFDSNLIIKPKLVTIEPKTLQNFNKLSNIPNFDETCLNRSVSHSVSSFNTGFDSLQRTVSDASTLSASSNGSIKDIVTKKLGSFKNYVFFSNRLTSILQRRLGKLATKFEYQSLYQFEARKFQYSLLNGDIRFIKDFRNQNIKNNKNHTDYLIFKFGIGSFENELYAVCERNDRCPQRQPWCCQHILTLNEMISFFKLNDISNDAKLRFLSNLKISDNVVNKEFNANLSYNSNVNKIVRMLKHGFFDFQKGCEKRRNCNAGRNKNNKLKNEDKFSYLTFIANEMQIDVLKLLDLIGDSIEDAFKFALKYPKTVLTQAYIDEERGNISFELVLQGEVLSNKNGINKYYKFGIPIVKCQNKQTKEFYYEARNILTPKMAIDNVRLNSKFAQLDNNTFIANLNNFNMSFYEKIEINWFINNINNKCNNLNLNYEEYSKEDSVSVLSKSSESRETGITFYKNDLDSLQTSENDNDNESDSENDKFVFLAPIAIGNLRRRSIDSSDDDYH